MIFILKRMSCLTWIISKFGILFCTIPNLKTRMIISLKVNNDYFELKDFEGCMFNAL